MGEIVVMFVFVDLFGFEYEVVCGWVLWMEEDIGDIVLFDDGVVVYDCDLVVDMMDYVYFVGDEDDG